MQRILQEKYLVKQLQRFQQLTLLRLILLDFKRASDLVKEVIILLRLNLKLQSAIRHKLQQNNTADVLCVHNTHDLQFLLN